jgi:haloacetate dehalogenase
MFEGFETRRLDVGDAVINARVGGSGPPLLLLHGYPQTHALWHRVAGPLAERFTVVATDLRGYGDSTGPTPEPSGANYTFRNMAADQVRAMQALGFPRFRLAGHDRGARTAHRLTLDHPDAVERLALLDIQPTHYAWTEMPAGIAKRAWHWILCAQPHDLAERFMTSVDPDWLLGRLIPAGPHGRDAMSDESYAEYRRCLTPAMIAASCADYRAFSSLDVQHDEVDRDAGRKVECPLLTMWGEHYDSYDMLELWGRYAFDVRGGVVPGAGHYLPEEAPDAVLRELSTFFGGA